MNDFEFPTNIKQIGSIGHGMKIYMEDYACSYLQQYAASGGYDEKLALLVGRSLTIDGQPILFISGAIQAKDTAVLNGLITFTSKTWDYANEQVDKYFHGLEIVGWMQSQPGYGTYLNVSYANYHLNTFIQPHQVLFVIDPIEKLNAFYILSEDRNELIETRGYFIYYEKNMNMHEYMLQNRVVKPKTIEQEEIKEEESKSILESVQDTFKIPDSHRITYPHQPRLVRDRPARLRTREEPRRIINMLVSLSAVLILVCVVMGTGLVQNEGRITTLEDELTKLNTSYKNLMVQLNQSNTASVFAAQGENVEAVNSGADEAAAVVPTQAGDSLSESAVIVREDGNEILKSEPSPSAPTPTVSPQVSSIPDTYMVQEGDNLGYISMKFYGTRDMVDKIMELNGLTDSDKIFFGKELKLPKQ